MDKPMAVKKVVVNIHRKTDTLRQLEEMGFKRYCFGYENLLRIFGLGDGSTCHRRVAVFDLIRTSRFDRFQSNSFEVNTL